MVRVCSEAELAPGEIKRAPTEVPIAVYNLSGSFFATGDYCTHEKSSFSEEGYLDGEEIECGWHFARFCIKTGAVTAPPARKPLLTYDVCVRDGDVYVILPSAPSAVANEAEENTSEA
jgi:nitrite reductase/ring-hydroxylating ferredoxin subunit